MYVFFRIFMLTYVQYQSNCCYFIHLIRFFYPVCLLLSLILYSESHSKKCPFNQSSIYLTWKDRHTCTSQKSHNKQIIICYIYRSCFSSPISKQFINLPLNVVAMRISDNKPQAIYFLKFSLGCFSFLLHILYFTQM